jgi:ABC-type transport system involved in multi-copper enzyme maturation permease subunit
VYVMSLLNPIPALVTRTQMMLAGGRSVPAPVLWHCLTILAGAAVILALAVRRVRRVALAQQGGLSREATPERVEGRDTRTRIRHARRPIRRVKGPPVVWKELRTSVWEFRKRLLLNAFLWIVIGTSFGALLVPTSVGLGSLWVPIALLQGLLILRLAVAAAGTVTREKEAQTWPILLTTPLGDREIVKGKAVAVFRENEWLLLPLLALYLLVDLLGPMRDSIPLSFLFLLSAYLGLAGTVAFLLGLGLYLSTRLKTTTGAVVATLALYFVPKLFFCGAPGPWLLLPAHGSLGAFRGPVTATLFAVSLIPPAFYAAAGLACLRAATRRLRRDVF